MKKIVTLFLAISLLFLYSCAAVPPSDDVQNEEDNYIYTDLNYSFDIGTPYTLTTFTEQESEIKNSLLGFLENEKLEEKDISGCSGNVRVEKAFVINDRLALVTSLPENYNYITDKILIVDEKELYPNALGEYVYVFFDFEWPSIDMDISDFNSVNLDSGVLSVNLTRVMPRGTNDAILPATLIFKIQKSLLK